MFNVLFPLKNPNQKEDEMVHRDKGHAAPQVQPNMKRQLNYTENLMLAIVDFDGGPWADAMPMHQHPHEQVTYIASGRVVFSVEGQEDVELQAGDSIAVPSNAMHTVKLLSDAARLIDAFTPIREDFL